MKPKITLTITRPTGHTSSASLGGAKQPTSAMFEAAEALLAFLSTGEDPRAACGSCGIRRDKHKVRHFFVEEP
jgi:hypothetical protein